MTVTLGTTTPAPVAPWQSGEMARFFSAERGCSRSGDRARRSKGDPLELLLPLLPPLLLL